MPVRIQPWPLPTIPGQASNEEGGDTGNVSYIDMDNLQVTAYAVGQNVGGRSFNVYKGANHAKNGVRINISGLQVIDITGLTVIEEVVSDFTVNGTTEIEPKAAIATNKQQFAYSVGANVNREIFKRDYQSITLDGVEISRDHVTITTSTATVNGSVTVTIKVVNAMGVILQKKTVTATPTLEVIA